MGRRVDDATPSVGRFGFVSGWIVGLSIAGLGLYQLATLELPKWLSVTLEMALVALGIVATTFVWRLSATVHAARNTDADPGSSSAGLSPSVEPGGRGEDAR